MRLWTRSLRAVLTLAAVLATVLAGLFVQPPAPAAALDNDLALTPPMGWNSWNQLRCYDLDEQAVKDAADAIVDRRLQDVGYEYVVVDDCWQGGRGADGVLFSHPERFPSGIAALADYVHARGLKFGIYSSPGSETCANYWDSYPIYGIGSYGHEETDAQTFADWGVDYLKYDWCRADETDGLTRPAAFAHMRDALAATGRDIVYGISEYGETQPWTWAAPIANLWRTTHDIRPNWASVAGIIQDQAALASFSGPGAWNDPDMLQVGNGTLTLAENRAHFGMWSMLAAPLFMGTEIGALSQGVVDVVTNPEVVAIDQDALGQQAHRVSDSAGLQVWARTLADGDIAVALLNTTGQAATISTTLAAVGAGGDSYIARDLWSRTDFRNVLSTFGAQVASHDVALLRLTPGSDPSLPGAIDVTGRVDLERGATATAAVQVTNATATALQGATLSVATGAGLTVPTAPIAVPSVPAGGTVSVAVPLQAAANATLGARSLRVTLAAPGTPGAEGTLTVTVVPPTPTADTHVSALPLLTAVSGWGQVRVDRSVDNKPLTVNGVVWERGLGTHAASTIEVWLGGACTSLSGGLGIDDETLGGDPRYGYPSIGGAVLGDGQSLWQTSAPIRYQQQQSFTIDVTDVRVLTLQVDTAGDGNAYDHADWLDLALECGTPAATPVEVTAEPRCLAGRVYLYLSARNVGEDPVSLTLQTAFGSKTFTSLAPDRVAGAALPTRVASVSAGEVTVTATVGGSTFTETVGYPALTCTP